MKQEMPPPLPAVEGNPRFMPLSSLLANAPLCRVLVLLGSGLLLWLANGQKLWPCWFFEVTQRPCFTCGMTRGVKRCLTGDFDGVGRAHPFAPILILGFGMLCVFALLPRAWHRRALRAVRRMESTTRATWGLLGAFLIYGLLRITGVIAFQP